ncbi:MAG: glutamate mutase L [Anaerolineaceae bacterium]|nr:glutamate mutase L [Anaerolineaceae bacterium]
MTTSIIDAESLLAIDIGTTTTRASLFDVVEGQYRYMGSGKAASTVDAPHRDVSEGLFLAVRELEAVSGRKIIDRDAQLILPSTEDGWGVDRLVLTHSAGPDLKIVAAGLLEEVSLGSAQELAATISGEISESFGLNDRRRIETQIDTILRVKPDLVILTGGTENGANRSVFKLVEMITMVCRIQPKDRRPDVIYAGNRVLAKKIKEILSKWTNVYLAPNVRPSIEHENLAPVKTILAKAVFSIRAGQLGGLKDISSICSTQPIPTSHGLGRMIQFLSKAYGSNRGVLGVDLGSRSSTTAAALNGKLNLNVLPNGMGKNIQSVLENDGISTIMKWLPVDISENEVRDYILQKSLYPGIIPNNYEALSIERAVVKTFLSLSLQELQNRFPDQVMSFEPYIVSGSALTETPSPGQSLLMMLDGLQPVGVTTMVLDQKGLLAGLGAAASINSLIPVQVLESGVFLNLGTVICPSSKARLGAPILRAKLEFEDGRESRYEIKKGTLVTLPVQSGQTAKIHLETLRRTVIDPYSHRRSGSFKIVGGVCGVVIDARGRPISLPSDDEKRRKLIKKWEISLT